MPYFEIGTKNYVWGDKLLEYAIAADKAAEKYDIDVLFILPALESGHHAVSFHDITNKVKEIAAKSGLKDGIVVVYSHHTTCSVITQECAFDMSMTGLETLQQDLVNAFEEWIPTCRYEGQYLHPGQKALVFAEEHGEDNFGAPQRAAPGRTGARTQH